MGSSPGQSGDFANSIRPKMGQYDYKRLMAGELAEAAEQGIAKRARTKG